MDNDAVKERVRLALSGLFDAEHQLLALIAELMGASPDEVKEIFDG